MRTGVCWRSPSWTSSSRLSLYLKWNDCLAVGRRVWGLCRRPARQTVYGRYAAPGALAVGAPWAWFLRASSTRDPRPSPKSLALSLHSVPAPREGSTAPERGWLPGRAAGVPGPWLRPRVPTGPWTARLSGLQWGGTAVPLPLGQPAERPTWPAAFYSFARVTLLSSFPREAAAAQGEYYYHI